jgi:hypothetical protein
MKTTRNNAANARFGNTCKSKFFCTIIRSFSFIRIVGERNETWGHWHKNFLKLHVFNSGYISRNWPKCNHSICNYMQLLIICNYIWTFLQLFLVLVIFVITLQLIRNYFDIHPYMWTTFSLVFIQEEQFYVPLVANVTNLIATLWIYKGIFCEFSGL